MTKCNGITKDLDRSEEVALVKIALNPDSTGEEIKDELNTNVRKFSDCVDTLIERGYIELGADKDERNWRITELGRLALRKFSTVLKFDLTYARKSGQNKDVLDRLKSRKLMFERALNAARDRVELDNGSQ